MTAVWSSAANDVWAIAYPGAIVHYDAMGDVLRYDGTCIRYFSALSVAGAITGVGNDLWAVGSGGAIMHKAL